MLHAFSHNKSRLYRRYLSHRDETTELKVAEEDEMTSTLMGPLAFLSPAAIAAFWCALVYLRNPEHALPTEAPTDAQMYFWPRKGRIEPDLRVELSWGAHTRILLVEFKWRAPLSGKEQLHDQWEHYLDVDEQSRALHLFIGLDTSEASNALNRRDVWNGKLIMRSWFDILTAVSAIRTGPGLELRRWSEQVRRCLKLLAVEPFSGFEDIAQPQLPAASDHVFSRDLRLTSFESALQMSETGKAISASVAFLSKVGVECEALANLIKQELGELFRQGPLHSVYEPGGWSSSYKTDASGWVFNAVAWTLPLAAKGKVEATAHLAFQMSFLCDDAEGGFSPEPLLHINLWSEPTNVRSDCYMGFEMYGISPRSIARLQDGSARLFRRLWRATCKQSISSAWAVTLASFARMHQ